MKKQRREIVDFQNLEYFINEVERLFKEEELNAEDQGLVLNKLLARHSQRLRQAMTNDLIQNVSLGGLMGRITKSIRKKEDEGDEE